jgi:dihydroorotate dehydrogenase electron transfer subunit
LKTQQPYQPFRLAHVRNENQATNSLIFDQPLINAQPGQFVMLWLPGVGEKPFSILNNDPFSIAVTSVGPFSNILYDLPVGSRVWLRGPLGQGFKLEGIRHLLVGGGYGAAPLLFLAQQARGSKEEVKVCLGARSNDDLMMIDAFKSAGCNIFITTDDGSSGEKGLVTQAINQVLLGSKIDSIYACGPVPMLSALSEIARKDKIPAQLSWEANMRCGIGLCGSCELEEETRKSAGIPVGWLTCKDGPVFFQSR